MKSAKKILPQGVTVVSRHNTDLIRYSLAVLLALISLIVNAGIKDPETQTESETVAATVNGVPIKISELSPQVNEKLHKYNKYGIQTPNDELLKSLRLEALERLISAELLYQEASKLKLDDLQKRVDAKLLEAKERHEESGDFDENGTREILTKQILINTYLVRNKLKDTEPLESDIKAYYEKNKEAFRQEEAIRTRHILASVDADAEDADKATARAKIEEARKLIQGGKPFNEIAKEYSDCNSASSGGELGYHERGYMPEAYDQAAHSLEKGKLSNIIETKFGYHILEVLDHRSAGIQPYEKVRDFIARYIKQRQNKKAMEEHLSKLRKKAEINIYL